jgi:copper resistance protein B
MHEMKHTILPVALLAVSSIAVGAGADDPLLTKVMIDQLEWREADGDNPVVLEADAWIGKDLHKLWFKADVEHVSDELEEANLQALYSRAIAPYWDFQIGWRHDFKPKPTRDWLAVGFKGLAPYFFEVDATAFVGEAGQIAANLNAEYEFMFTQRVVLSPEIDLNFYREKDPEHGIGSGLSDMQAGLRLRYEIRREFAPYVGVNWVKKFGGTADFARDEGEPTSDVQLVAGIRAWF